MKLLKWLLIILGAILVLLLVLINLAAPRFRTSDQKITTFFTEAGIDYKIHSQDYEGEAIRWVEAGDLSSKSVVLFFHGAPGGFGDFSGYMKDADINQNTRLITFDRPGYGHSRYGKAEPSIIKQAEMAHYLMEQIEMDTLILVGYSYGGPISGAYAARYPDKIKALLMLAPVNAPDAEKIFWFNPIINTWAARLVLPGMIKVANVEKLSHADALDAIRADWPKIKAPVVHLHCTDDWIAPYAENRAWSEKHIPAAQLEMVSWTGASHFLPNQQMERIKPVLLDLIRQ